MVELELVLVLLLAVFALALMARRIATPLPVILVIGGLALGIGWRIVGARPIVLPPDLAFFVFLPPLLVSAAFTVPLDAFRANLRPITLLAIGLVLATMACVGEVAYRLVPGMPRGVGYVLGAIVAPPDAVAATTIARRLGLPNRLVTILEGEGLVNDATALVAYRLAVIAVVTGHFTWLDAGLQFLGAGLTGVLTGLAVGWLAGAVLRRIEDEVLETAFSLLTPYIAYLAADRLGGSGVLAVVTLGFMLRRHATDIHSAPTRLAARTVWDTLVFLINGLVFILIGIQLGQLAARGMSPRLIAIIATVSGVAIAVRLAWMFLIPHLLRIVTLGHEPDRVPSGRELFVLGWAGMRGVVSLAAALAVPTLTRASTTFPARDAIVILTFGVIFSTLVAQGVSLGPLIRALGVADPTAPEHEERTARSEAVRAAVAHIRRLMSAGKLPRAQGERLRQELERDIGLGAVQNVGEDDYRSACHAALELERQVVLRLRENGTLSDSTARRLEEELDVTAVQLRNAAARSEQEGREHSAR